ncbi:MAG TPA: M6 family metalloprotease domain-containing protein, partial [Phycisphaerae bacterium]|nr:M6 family metalloprotease domain-containing protein [Phycisphaerae bacterium]
MLRSLTVRLACAVCVAVTVQILAVHAVWAAPVNGEQFRLPQPDGTWVDVRIWGDEFYGVTESLDGYTLVRDPATLFICYATLSADGKELVSTGVPAGTGPRAVPGLVPHLRIDPSAARSQASAVRARLEAGHEMMRDGGEPRRPRIGNIVGICLIVDFEDEPWTIPRATVDDYCNLAGFTGFGDNGSVRDYFFDVSDGALTYTNFVPTAYYRATHPKSYYTDPAIPFGQRARELIIEALTDLDAQGFDFSQYDADGDGNVDAVNCFYAGTIWNNWSEGLWPHSGWFSFCADGVCAQRYQISNMGSSLRLRTFCHETGHMLFNWPDLYDYDYDSKGLGKFCLMAYSTTDTNPSEPCAYLKYIAGWSQTTLLTVPQTGLVAPGPGINRIYKFNHPTLANEYYLIDNRQQAGRDSGLPDGGLAIWHIDTLGDNSDQQMTPELHYLVTLVQADGRWDLEHNLGYGDATDLWTAPQYTQCTPATTPNTNWWSGAASGLSITGISGSANMMAFDYGMPSDPRNIMAWGMNDSGQCDVPVPNGEFVAVAAGRGHTLGLRANGSIAAWGLNDHGQCNIPEPNTGFVAIAAGGWHSLGLKADGSLVAWGLNDHGQCDIPEPNTGFAAIAGGGYHSLGLKADGSITAWGADTDESGNYIGQCDVLAPNAGFVAVSAGGFHSLGLKVDGSIVAWGAGQAGQSGHP